jgi:membrane protein DedA with SNARE-associated domain
MGISDCGVWILDELPGIHCETGIERFLDFAWKDNMHHLLEIWFRWVLSGGYVGIIALMAMGSTPLPVPAEAVIPPAAFLAAKGDLSFAGVIVAGTLGSYLGAVAMYWLSLSLGRPLLLRYGRCFLLNKEKLERAEGWLKRYEAGGIFFARILPIIRHFISIPAGVVRMPFTTFSAVTIAGAAVANCTLAYLGAQAYRRQPDLLSNPEGLVQFVKTQSHWIVLLVVAFALLYLAALRLSQPAKR